MIVNLSPGMAAVVRGLQSCAPGRGRGNQLGSSLGHGVAMEDLGCRNDAGAPAFSVGHQKVAPTEADENVSLARIGRHPPAPFHVEQHLFDARLDRNIESGRRFLSNGAVLIKAMAVLKTLHRFDQGRIVEIAAARRICQIADFNKALAKQGYAQIDHVRLQGLTLRYRLPATVARDLAIGRKCILEAPVLASIRGQARQKSSQIVGLGCGVEKLERIGIARIDEELGIDFARIQTTGMQIAAVAQQGAAQEIVKLGVCFISVCLPECFYAADIVVRRLEAIVTCITKGGCQHAPLGTQTILFKPNRLVVTVFVEVQQRQKLFVFLGAARFDRFRDQPGFDLVLQ